ncbi:MFS transporter [Acidiferrimicrobium sp. IK]|uniref:MFS transporter n=1 Tax=Acidiferrimicrobium sp. IK TaxID=2871700 RepID=UPI0021CAEC3F|nr:MFS transporter [Acidiferrimicrobium sp. IK]MCU4183989.1 MFS transporter [Acidiferrimicrobium sp. IK]
MASPHLPAAVQRTFSSLRVRNYRYYFAGQSVSMIGTWMQSTTQAWLVLQLTGSGTDLGLVVALQTLPILLFGPIGGTIADRFGKYRILFWTQGLAGVQALALAVLDLTGHLQLWEIYVIACSLGFVNMVDNPTRQTFIVEMVGRDELTNAVTLNSVMVNVARAVGPAIGGILIATVGSGWCFLVNAISFVFVLGGLRAIHQDELTPAPIAARAKGQLREGFRYVARTPVLRDALLMMAVIGCLAYEFQVTLPLMAHDVFHGGSTLYGLLNSAQGIGAVIGGLAVAGRPRTGSRRLLQVATVFGAVMVLAALAPTPAFEIIALLLVGGASVSFLALGNSTLQLNADPSMRGRVMSLWSVAFLGSTPVGGPVVGIVAGALGARFGLGLGAVAIAGAVAFGWRSLRRRDPAVAPDGGAADLRPAVTSAPGSGSPAEGPAAEAAVADLATGAPGTVADRADPRAPRPDSPQCLPSPTRAT